MNKSKNLFKKFLFCTFIMQAIVSTSIIMATQQYTTYVATGIEYVISLSDENITVNGTEISSDVTNNVYLSNQMNNGGTSDESQEANIEIENVINITQNGTYYFQGELSNGQISVDSNSINGTVVIVLDGANITCEEAPAIFIYNVENKSDSCNVVIRTTENTENIVSGGRLKQNVEGWNDQSDILYHIEKGNDDDGTYYERYKYDGAISSDVSLTFEGTGTLIINSFEKEGIESKQDITFDGGNYIINSYDDGINACTDGESVITINDGTILVNVLEEAEEGDGIDSNGSIYINGGRVYAFASEKSQDSGLDSDMGIYINGGYVVGTGNMADAISQESKQKYLLLQFNEKVQKDGLITIVNQKDEAIVAFQGDREYSVLAISTPQLTNNEEYTIYEGGEIAGEAENGMYTNITSYEKGTMKEYNENVGNRGPNFGRGDENTRFQSNTRIYQTTTLVLGIILVILLLALILAKKNGNLEKKGKVMLFLIGLVLGATITSGAFWISQKTNELPVMPNFDMMGENPNGQMPPMGNEPR